MFKRFITKRSSFIGVDIGSTSVKILEVSRHKKQLCIEACAYQPLIPGTGREQLILSLQSLLTENATSAKIAAVAVPDSALISKTTQFAESLTEIEMRELSLLEAKKYIPCSSNEIYIDFAVLGAAKDALGLVEVLWVASRAENIRKRVEILREVGLDVKIVGMESQIIAAAASQIVTALEVNETSKAVFAIIHIDFSALHLNIFHNAKLIYSKEEILDPNVFEETAVKYYETTQTLKEHPNQTEHASKFILPLILSLVLHIKRSLSFFSTSFSEAIDGIFLTGELGSLAGIDAEIAKETNLKIAKYNPKNISFSSKVDKVDVTRMFSLYTLSFGLIVRLIHEY